MRVTQFGKLRIPWERCVLCGEKPEDVSALTPEHIPPRALFLDKRRPNPYLVVPACIKCNRGSSLEDEHLLEVLSASSPGSDEARELWQAKVRPNFKRRPAHRIRLRNHLIDLPHDLPDGVKVSLPGLAVEIERFNRSIEKMVRGLYWVHSRRLLSQSASLVVKFYNILQLQSHEEAMASMPLFKQCVAGLYRNPSVVRTFFYKGAFSDEPDSSIWYFGFYRQNMVAAATQSAAPEVAISTAGP